MILLVASTGGMETASLSVKTMFQRKQYDIPLKAALTLHICVNQVFRVTLLTGLSLYFYLPLLLLEHDRQGAKNAIIQNKFTWQIQCSRVQ